MLLSLPISSFSLLRLVSILIAFCFLLACSSRQSASVHERSSVSAKGVKLHIVSAGETLYSIAFRYGIDYKKLAEFNAIKAPYRIFPSQKISIYKMPNTREGNAQRNVNISAQSGVITKNNSMDGRSKKGTNYVSGVKNSTTLGGSPRWQWPVSGKLIAPFQGESGVNKGIDLSGKLGEPVLAAASGRVVYAGGGLSGYGKLLIIKHNETFLSAYAHNDEISVKEGDVVKAGQRIADMGSSGTDRVKLHFEIRSEGSPVDPLKFLPKR